MLRDRAFLGKIFIADPALSIRQLTLGDSQDAVKSLWRKVVE